MDITGIMPKNFYINTLYKSLTILLANIVGIFLLSDLCNKKRDTNLVVSLIFN